MPLCVFIRHRAHLAPGIGEEFQFARGGDRRILLAQRARGGIARIGIDRLLGRDLPLVERGEIRMQHVDFAADLAHVGNWFSLQHLRDIVERPDVGCDVLTFRAVAARRRGHKLSALVAQRHREPIDFRLSGEDQCLVFGQFQKAPDAVGKIGHILI